MANRLTKITTKTGDDGTTGLGDGTRIRKDDVRVEVLGDVDELNSALGVLLAEPLADSAADTLRRIQNTLFDLGGEVCIPGHRTLDQSDVEFLDLATSELNSMLPPLKEFVLPSGSRAAALCHVTRTIARRAERSLVRLHARDAMSSFAIQYLNRLSDFLFVLARTINRDAGVKDTLWTRRANDGKAAA